jgi:hypothetical protein
MENREGNVAVPFLVTLAWPKVRQFIYSLQNEKIFLGGATVKYFSVGIVIVFTGC